MTGQNIMGPTESSPHRRRIFAQSSITPGGQKADHWPECMVHGSAFAKPKQGTQKRGLGASADQPNEQLCPSMQQSLRRRPDSAGTWVPSSYPGAKVSRVPHLRVLIKGGAFRRDLFSEFSSDLRRHGSCLILCSKIM